MNEYPDRFWRRDLGSDLHQNHDGRGNGYRRSRLQKDAEWAVIGVGSRVERMNVRHLDHDQQRQQCEAHQRSHLQALQPAAENAAGH